MAYDPSKYDPNVIIRSADEKLAANDLEGGQMVFQSALLDWVDDARESSSSDPESLQEAVATLWIAYANYLARAKQFKSATEAYEQAVQCPIGGAVGRVWLDYARYSLDRGKLKTAQDVYIRALVGRSGQPPAVTDEQDQELLWLEFLEMMKQNNPDLTMEDLKSAVQTEAASPEAISSSTSVPQPLTSEEPPTKRPRIEGASSPLVSHQQQPPQDSKTHVVTAEFVAVEASALTEILGQKQLPPEIAGAWMVRDGTSPPTAPDPPLFQPNPPRLSDTAGKGLLGGDLALAVIERLLEPSGNIVLQVCRGLWTLQALKEKEASQAIALLDKTMTIEHERLESNLEARMAVAGAASTAVQQVNASERTAFQNTCSQQRQNLLSGIAWEFRQLLCVQQQVLCKLKVPGFAEGPTVESQVLQLQSTICSFLHSAFYLCQRIGQDPHVSMLQSQAERLRRDHTPSVPSYHSLVQAQTGFTGSAPPPPPMHQQQQQPMMGGGYQYPSGQPPMMQPGQMMMPPSQPPGGYPGQYPPYYHQ